MDLTTKENFVAVMIKSAPTYGKLLAAYRRHLVDIYGAVRANTSPYEEKPWELITADAGVMRQKSARCQTLAKLASMVIAETGLPRKLPGMYRGMNGIDWEKIGA